MPYFYIIIKYQIAKLLIGLQTMYIYFDNFCFRHSYTKIQIWAFAASPDLITLW